MDIKWKDGKGNILNANKKGIKYLDAESNNKVEISKDEIKVVEIEDRLMNIYRDFNNDLIISVVIPKDKKKAAKRIYNEFDKTGKLLKGNTGTFLLDLILESSMVLGNPLVGGVLILFVGGLVLNIALYVIKNMLGEAAIILIRYLILAWIIYTLIQFILTLIKRKRLKEN